MGSDPFFSRDPIFSRFLLVDLQDLPDTRFKPRQPALLAVGDGRFIIIALLALAQRKQCTHPVATTTMNNDRSVKTGQVLLKFA